MFLSNKERQENSVIDGFTPFKTVLTIASYVSRKKRSPVLI